MLGAIMFAQTGLEPVVLPDATARKISSDGKWVACYGMAIVEYNVETKEIYDYPECSLGIGNAVALDGTIVGSKDDASVFMRNGEVIYSDILESYQITGINGITPDGSRITGYVRNPILNDNYEGDPFDDGTVVFLPFYANMKADGTIEKINILPYPEKDFLGNSPMYVTGEWISEDGKTILGKMTDSYGRFEDPVIFHENNNGEWSCMSPTKEFNNPTGIEIPENPWLKAPSEPKLKDYMTELGYQAYLKDLEESLFGGPEVNPLDYMSEEMAQKYIKDYIDYENYYTDHRSEFEAYEKAYREVLTTSTFFLESALNPNGKTFATSGVFYDEEGTEVPSKVYIFNTETGEYQKLESPYSGLKIHQVLSDGTVIAYTGLFTYDVLKGYILLPGANDFIPFSKYLSDVNSSYSQWLEETFPKGEGIISASDDLSVIAGGVDALHLADDNFELFPDSTILSYILPKVKSSGVESIELPDTDGIYKVYNLMGVKVLETKDKSEINNLGKGIYIVNGKKIVL